MRRRLLFVSLLAALLALAAGIAWWRGHSNDDVHAPLAARERVSLPPPTGPELQGAAHEDGTRGRERAPGTESVKAPPAPDEIHAFTPRPPDPLAQGACSLTVVCTDEAGASAHDLKVELWRLGAPANAHWLAGDQRQASTTTQGGRVTWDALPAGRYRVFVPGLRAQAEDPPAFDVAGAQTTVALVMPLPRCAVLRVRAFDEHGANLESAWTSLIRHSSFVTGAPPPWSTERLPRSGEPLPELPSRGASAGGPSGYHVGAGPKGFEIGTCCESTRTSMTSFSAGLELPGRTHVHLEIKAGDVRPPAPLDYVGLSLPLELITSRVWLPGGRRARDAGARFDAACHAVAAPGPTGTLDPLSMPVHVTVSLEGYAQLQFEFLLAERWHDHTMEPAPAAGEPGPR